MSREILFRGLRADGGGWVEGGCFTFIEYEKMEYEKPVAYIFTFDNATEVISASVGQFTNLPLDKNGKRIWEHDIIRSFHFTGPGNKKNYLCHKIVWSDEFYGWQAVSMNNTDESFKAHGNPMAWVYLKNAIDFEVIGSIHSKQTQP